MSLEIENPSVVVEESIQDMRAKTVKSQLETLQGKTEDNIFDVCDLLMEAQDNEYHRTFGFANFMDWVEMNKDFGLTRQVARYYIVIARKSLHFNLDRPTMKRIKISKLREIFRLDVDEHAEEIKTLLAEAEALTLDEVKAKVRSVLQGDGVEDMVFMTIKFPQSAKQVIDDAFERCRQVNGNYEQAGEVVEISNGTVLERICLDFLSSTTGEDTASDLVETEVLSV